jgi:hypothetical protein
MIAELSLTAALLFGAGIEHARHVAEHRPVPGGPTVLERCALEQASARALEGLRAGAPAQAGAGVAADERAALAAAQKAAPDLERQRAGDLTDREVAIIAITAAVILLLIIIF